MDAFGVEDRVEGARELAVVVTDQELQRSFSLGEREHEVPGLLRCPRTIGVLGQPGEVYSPGRELDEEQHVDSPQRDRVDREEVAREHALRLAADELAPGKPSAPSRRSEPGAGEDPTDARWGDLDTERDQLSGDPLVSPPRVLPRESQHELADIPADLGADGTAPRIRPVLGDEPAVPCEKRFRGDEERAPPRPRE